MTENNDLQAYPLEIRGDLSPELSRWLWLVKWILAIPHIIVLIFLSIAFIVLTIVAFFAILITARYPRGMFNFNVGVMRWWWRVAFYAIGPLGTDRYPPFSLASDDDYPADLSVDYPERLSRVKVLFKWWLLAIPHYAVILFFAGAGNLLGNAIRELGIGFGILNWAGEEADPAIMDIGVGIIETGVENLILGIPIALGLAGTLALIAVITLLFRGFYPADMFGLQMGMHRWTHRVTGYVMLLYDDYPPFRFRP